MFSKIWTRNFTHDSSAQVEQFRKSLDDADTVILGAGAGLSTAAGFVYGGERFRRYFYDFASKYGFHEGKQEAPRYCRTEGLLAARG